MATLQDERRETHAPKAGDSVHSGNGHNGFDPDEFRMTLGEHLEELRARMILSLMGFVVAAVVCLALGEHAVEIFCRPGEIALQRNHLPPHFYITDASEAFMTYIKVSLILAACLASPWMVYQIWQFVASGLYSHERKYITKYLPLSITLLIVGMLFLYFYVLPVMLQFFIGFQIGPTIAGHATIDSTINISSLMHVPVLQADPAGPPDGSLWFNAAQQQLKIVLDGHTRIISFGTDQLITPILTLEKYIEMVVGMLLAFGLAFQMPLVVLALVRIGIVDVDMLKKSRRFVYFGMSIVAAVIVPDVITGMIALMIPLILLFEMGLWMAREPKKKPGAAS